MRDVDEVIDARGDDTGGAGDCGVIAVTYHEPFDSTIGR